MKETIRGALFSLDLVGMLRALGLPITEAKGEPGKYWVLCPWSNEHSDTGRSDTVVWQEPGRWPRFHCSHAHCAGRNINTVLGWAESCQSGIVDSFCSRDWQKRTKDRSKPREQKPVKRGPIDAAQAIRNTESFLNEFRIDEADLWHASSIYPGGDWKHDSLLLLGYLYQPGEFVCICTEFAIHAKKDGSQKAVPKGIGRTKTSADWIEILQREGCLNAGLAGAWIRLNPVTLSGSGTNGAHRDADVTGYRYLLVESDSIGFELQISLYAKLALPIAALITSGGQSVHAVVKVDAATEMDFRADAAFVLGRLAQFGIDPANGNPSRYGRMPGVQRSIGAVGDGQQRLLYFSPQPKGGSIF